MSSSNQETRKLAAYIKDMNYDHFDEHTIDITKMCILDFMGVAIAGSAKKESSIWKEYYAEKVTAPQASLFQPGFQNMTAEQAAALNAVFGHVMDMDDVHNASITHLAVITVPTAFALAQKLHLSGKQVIEQWPQAMRPVPASEKPSTLLLQVLAYHCGSRCFFLRCHRLETARSHRRADCKLLRFCRNPGCRPVGIPGKRIHEQGSSHRKCEPLRYAGC